MKFFLHFIHVLVEDLPSRKFGETRGAPSYIFSSFHHQKGNFSISTLSKSFFLFSDAEINDNVKFFPRHFTYHMKKNQEKGLIFFPYEEKKLLLSYILISILTMITQIKRHKFTLAETYSIIKQTDKTRGCGWRVDKSRK